MSKLDKWAELRRIINQRIMANSGFMPVDYILGAMDELDKKESELLQGPVFYMHLHSGTIKSKEEWIASFGEDYQMDEKGILDLVKNAVLVEVKQTNGLTGTWVEVKK